MTEDLAPRHRAPSLQVERTRAAMKAVLPLSQQIGAWQTKTVRLIAFAEKLKATGRSEPRLLEEARALLAEVMAQRLLFVTDNASLPPEVAGNGRILDTVKALKTVTDGLDRAIRLLDGPDKPDTAR